VDNRQRCHAAFDYKVGSGRFLTYRQLSWFKYVTDIGRTSFQVFNQEQDEMLETDCVMCLIGCGGVSCVDKLVRVEERERMQTIMYSIGV
jgi:hypothetical protein